MTRLLLAGVALAAGGDGFGAGRGRAAIAGRLPQPRAAAYVPFFTWNGFYVGINAGYGFGRLDLDRHHHPGLDRQLRRQRCAGRRHGWLQRAIRLVHIRR